MAKIVLDKIENIMGKEENAGYQHFLLFPQCFQKALSSGLLKARIGLQRVKYYAKLIHTDFILYQIGITRDFNPLLYT